MNVLHINSYYFAASFYKNLYDFQLKNNIGIDVYVPCNRKYINREFRLGSYSKVAFIFNDFQRILFNVKHKRILRNVKTSYDFTKFDIIHAHSLFSNGYIAYHLHREFNIPYMVAVRNTDINIFFKKMWWMRKIGVEILKNANKIIFISEPYKMELLTKYIPLYLKDDIEQKIEIIPNGIDAFWNNNSFHRKIYPDYKKIRILCVSDINDNKNHLTTLKACKSLISEGYKVEFNLVGRILNNRIYNKLLKENFVFFHGILEKEQLIEMYRNNDIFIMPSKTETFGLVYAEAMSQGLPIIYTKGQGFDQQFMEGEVGYHVNSYDIKDINTAVELIYKDYLNISSRCSKNASKFNWQNIERKYFHLYKEIISK